MNPSDAGPSNPEHLQEGAGSQAWSSLTSSGVPAPAVPQGYLRAVLDEIVQGYVLLDDAGTFLEVNEVFCRLVELGREAVTGKRVECFAPPEYGAAWRGVVEAMGTAPAGAPFDAVLPLASGVARPVRVTSYALPPKGFPPEARRFVLVADLSDQLRAEQIMEEREERLRHALESVHDGTWEWHLPSGYFLFNKKFAEMLGFLPGEIPPELGAIKTLVHAEDLPALTEGVRKVLEGQSEGLDLEFRLRGRSGDPVWVLGRGRVTARDGRGRPLRLAGHTFNISRRKRMEGALLESEQRFRALLDSFPDWILQVDKELRVLWANEVVRRAFPDCGGRRCHELFYDRRDPCEECPCVSALRTGTLERRTFHRAAVGAHEAAYWEVAGIPLKNPQGEVTGLVEVGRNITEQIALEQGLRTERDRAEEASRVKGAFLANMSHELRTPMNAIIGMTDLLLETSLTREQRELLSSVRSSSGTLLEIIGDLLDLARIEAGRFELSVEPFSVRDLCVQVVWALDVAALRKGLTLEHHEEGPMPDKVFGDPLRLRQVLVNLIGNALKFTDRGRIVLTVRCRNREKGRVELFFEVKDTGIGILEEKKNLIFRPFSQVDSSSHKRFQGTGLGLVISRQIVETMGGTMDFESTFGQGSTFFFSVELPVVSWSETGFSSDLVPPSRRILMVEDDPMQALLLRRLLEQHGWDADVAPTGADAEDLFRHGSYDAVILEGHLADGRGREVARRLRNVEGKDLRRPFLVLGQAPEGDLDEGVEKPIEPEKLLDLLEKLVGASRTAAGHSRGNPDV